MAQIRTLESNAFGWFVSTDLRSPTPVTALSEFHRPGLPHAGRVNSSRTGLSKWRSECRLARAADAMENQRHWNSTENLDVTVTPVSFRKFAYRLSQQRSSDSCLGSDWSDECRTYQSTPSLLEEDQVASDIKYALKRLSSVTEHYKCMRQELGTVRSGLEGLHHEMEQFRERMQRTRYRPIVRKPATFCAIPDEITSEAVADVTYKILKQVCAQQLNLDGREHNFLV